MVRERSGSSPPLLRRVLFLGLSLGIILATGPGCGEPARPVVPNTENVSLSKVPEGVLAEAKRARPDVILERARLDRSSGGLNYELQGRDNRGRSARIVVSAAGKILAVE